MILLQQQRVRVPIMRLALAITICTITFPYSVLTYTTNSIVQNRRLSLTKTRNRSNNLYLNKDKYCKGTRTFSFYSSIRSIGCIQMLELIQILHLYPLHACDKALVQSSSQHLRETWKRKMTPMPSTSTLSSKLINRLNLSNRKKIGSLDNVLEDTYNSTISSEILNNNHWAARKTWNNSRVGLFFKHLINRIRMVSSYLFKRKETNVAKVRNGETKSMVNLDTAIFESENSQEYNANNNNSETPQPLQNKAKVYLNHNVNTESSSGDNVDVHENLTGVWDLIVTNEFKQSYDRYLQLLGQPNFVRSIALSIISYTTEETIQRICNTTGTELYIRTINARGIWERTLYTSSSSSPPSLHTNPTSNTTTNQAIVRHPIRTADNELVESEAWWEKNGTIHHSWLYGIKKYGGGDFESKRYLLRTVPGKDGEEHEQVQQQHKLDVDNNSLHHENSHCTQNETTFLICETTFHPNDRNREKPYIVWKFKRKTKLITT